MGAHVQADLKSRRLLRMAKAITHVVDGALGQPDSDFFRHQDAAVSANSLTQHQQKRLEGIVGRLSKARQIVKHLEGRFGVSDSGRFVDKNGLYRATMNDVQPQYLSARPNSFTVLYLVREEEMDKGSEGLSYTSDDLDAILDHNIREINGDTPHYFSLDVLCIFVSHLEMRTPAMLRGYVEHETGHVVGNVLHPKDDEFYFDEVFADLFARLPATWHIKQHQISSTSSNYLFRKDIHKRMKKRNASPHAVKMGAEEVKDYERFISLARKLPPSTFNDVAALGLDRRVLSIAVALTDYDRITPAMEQLRSYLERHPEEARHEQPALHHYKKS